MKLYINPYTNPQELDIANASDFDTLVFVISKIENHGLCRKWTENGRVYYDCGRTVLAVDEKDLQNK